MAQHRTTDELDAALPAIHASPNDGGEVRLVLRRPESGERELLDVAELSTEVGIVGDNWQARGSSKTDDGSAHPMMQVTLMNSRVIDTIAGSKELWPLAGDQIYVDLDLSTNNLPAGSLLDIGSARIEVTGEPHTGCAKFTQRFGLDAMRWVNSETGRAANLRGINCRVVADGEVRPGDAVRKA